MCKTFHINMEDYVFYHIIYTLPNLHFFIELCMLKFFIHVLKWKLKICVLGILLTN